MNAVRPPNLVVLVPTLDGRPQPACEEGLRELERRGIEVRRAAGLSRIDFARSLLATKAIEDGFEYLFWIDDDIAFLPDDVLRLAAADEPIIAGVCAKKGKRELAVYAAPGTASLTFGPRGGIVEVLYAGTGFLCTHRNVYEALAKELPICNEGFGQRVVPYFLPFVVNTERGPWYLGEDYAFCERARRAGFRVTVDSRVRLYHLGMYGYGWEDAGAGVERFEDYTFKLR